MMKVPRSLVVIALTLVSSLVDKAHGFIVVPSSNTSNSNSNNYQDSFASLPAAFGEPWEDSSVIRTHLQFIEARTKLCPNDEEEDVKIAVPTDGLPVTLLVERGDCLFIEKAQEAMALGSVQYIIIANNGQDNTTGPFRMTGPHFEHAAPLMISEKSGKGKIQNKEEDWMPSPNPRLTKR